MSSPRDDDDNEIQVEYYLTNYVPLFERLRWEIQDIEDLVKRFIELDHLSLPDDIQQALDFAAQYSSDTPPAWTEKQNTREKNTLEASQDFRSRKAYWHLNRVEELEKNLDRLRSWLIASVKDEGKLSKPLQLSFEREKKLHVAFLQKTKR